MQYIREELLKLQNALFDIMVVIDQICKEENISYFIIGGTALGAVRHGDIIPWDDDIDIGMTRDNYESFLSVAQEKLGDKYFLQHYKTDGKIPFYFTKIRQNGTKFVEAYCETIDMHHGIFVDIFPYDNLPDNLLKRKLHFRSVAVFAELFIAKSTKGIFHTNASRITGCLKRMTRITLHYLLLPISKDFLYRKMDKTCRKYNNFETTDVGYVIYPFFRMKTLNAKNVKRIKFGNLELLVSSEVEAILLLQYGPNYMALPSEEKRVNHCPIILDISILNNPN